MIVTLFKEVIDIGKMLAESFEKQFQGSLMEKARAI
jgi:hypothetical protein